MSWPPAGDATNHRPIRGWSHREQRFNHKCTFHYRICGVAVLAEGLKEEQLIKRTGSISQTVVHDYSSHTAVGRFLLLGIRGGIWENVGERRERCLIRTLLVGATFTLSLLTCVDLYANSQTWCDWPSRAQASAEMASWSHPDTMYLCSLITCFLWILDLLMTLNHRITADTEPQLLGVIL